MVRVLGAPIIEHIVRHLKGFGIEEIVFTLHYRPRAIQDHFGDGSDFGVRIHYTLEQQPLGTAGSVKLGARYLDEPFLVVAGDALMDFDFRRFADFHREKGGKVSICLMRVRDPGEFGIVITDPAARVKRFLEKPGPSEVFSDTVNTGIYLVEPDVLDAIPDGVPFDFSSDLFPALLERGQGLFGHVAEGYWSDIGTLEQLRQAHWDFLDGKVGLPIGGQRLGEQIWVDQDSEIAPDAALAGPCWVGENVRVNSGARVGPYGVLSDNVEIDAHATIHRSIVMRNCFVGEASELRNTIVAERTVIEQRCEIGDDTVIGAGCHLRAGVRVNSGVLIWPDKEIDSNAVITDNLIWETLLRPSIFGSRGVSGLANLHITPEFSAALGKAFGTWVKRGSRVAVSRDAHPFSRLIKRALVSGLLAVGVDVEDLEESSAPITRFLVGYGQTMQGGVHVRIADEHPSVALMELYDGDGLPLPRGVRRKIEATFHRADFPKVSLHAVGKLTYAGRVFERYQDHLAAQLDLDAVRRSCAQIVHYCPSRAAMDVFAALLGRRGIVHLQAVGLGGEEQEAVHRKVAEIARQNHAFGLVLGRNAEQLALVDESGALLGPERVIELLTTAFIQSARPEEPVFLAPDAPAFLRDLAQEARREIVVTRKEAAARLEEATARAGRDELWLEFTHFYLGFDGIAGALRLLEFLGSRSLCLHDFERQVPTTDRQLLVLPCPWDEMGRVMREVAERPEADLGAVPEGVRLQFPEGRVYVLPSADVPQIEVTVEAERPGRLADFVEQVNTELRRLIG
jgi:mannose-1-phosphate guanylyltransferase/phosphomannomutase